MRTWARTRGLVAALAMGWLAATSVGCGGYALAGKVVEGREPGVYVVSQSDPRLEQPPISGAFIDGLLDPDTLRSKVLDPVSTGLDGAFTMPVDGFGAGVLEYEIMVTARARHYAPVRNVIDLPGRRKRLLVVMTPGEDRAMQGDLMRETVEMGKPYMEFEQWAP